MPKVELKLDLNTLDNIHRAAQDAALETVGVLRGEIITAQVVPFDYGTLQKSMGAVDQFEKDGEIHTDLCIGDTPYARRLYHHPEYNYQKVNNPNAGGEWAKPWLPGGNKADFAPNAFRECMKRRMPK